jgi:hypothetical protein
MNVHVYVNMYMHVYVRVCICVYICICVYVCICECRCVQFHLVSVLTTLFHQSHLHYTHYTTLHTLHYTSHTTLYILHYTHFTPYAAIATAKQEQTANLLDRLSADAKEKGHDEGVPVLPVWKMHGHMVPIAFRNFMQNHFEGEKLGECVCVCVCVCV